MAVKYKHSNTYSMYYCTFTCYNWISLFDKTNSYDLLYDWFNLIKKDKTIEIIAYVIMPNHAHIILYFSTGDFNLNKLLSNGKRFIAYEIVNRLEKQNETGLLNTLKSALSAREIMKGQKHKVFKESFDAKPIYSDKFLMQKINYIHYNPVKGKWNLAEDFCKYIHSSASFYEEGIAQHFIPKHYNNL